MGVAVGALLVAEEEDEDEEDEELLVPLDVEAALEDVWEDCQFECQ